ncbi:MAG: hypothetical protein UT48_C0010G0021 [Parcubacteria group bacterium GW2011_GWE2_39_37]|uniref:Uncharacterized protein n=1 Tax=Candidatus Falkowbacteria bacterium GW2011_GWF2_39_8 TaxID=1618642 RepID=A0A0G0S8T7_9BACT|nr:MAG: hypothetical protein UT48_C0010G0021 [Parcubacteria group bacterium GW2011_GWE2_39_37]KKR31150.1 MAG: hypothetical protein UT64_C0071G0004 [Candidatus Falkowbacteria bacterium GW2011_GWF2_39_8]
MRMAKKIFLSLLLFTIIFVFFILFSDNANAQDRSDQLFFGGQEDELQIATGLGDRDPRIIIALLIRVALGFLGILVLMIILLAGFKWMTAGGDEERLADARKTFFSAIVGLIMILAAFAIAEFVIQAISTATGTSPI